MVGGIGDFDMMVSFFLGMVGSARFSSSFRSSSPSISSLIKSSIPMLVFWFQKAITREVSYLSTIVTSSISFASFFFLGRYLIELGGVIGSVTNLTKQGRFHMTNSY